MMYLNNKNRLSRSRHSTAQTGHTDRLFCSGDLDLDPMTLTHESDKDILMMYLHTKNKLFRRRFQNFTALQRKYNDNFLQYHIFHFHVLPFVLHRWKERHTDLHCKTVALYILVLRFHSNRDRRPVNVYPHKIWTTIPIRVIKSSKIRHTDLHCHRSRRCRRLLFHSFQRNKTEALPAAATRTINTTQWTRRSWDTRSYDNLFQGNTKLSVYLRR